MKACQEPYTAHSFQMHPASDDFMVCANCGEDAEFCPDCGEMEHECTCGTATWCPVCGEQNCCEDTHA